ncbi:TolC family protein [Synechococcus sp. AH-601-B19]|nr:TolC family protein [Synechococcus sp. AH-601-B19]
MKVFPSSLRFIISGLTIASLGSFAVKASAEYQQIPTNDNSRIDTFSDTSNQLAEIRSDFQKRSQEFSLEDATHYAIANNSTIQAAYKGVQSEQWNAISDKRLWWPRVSGAGPMGDITTIPTFPLVGQRYASKEGGSFSTSTTPSQSTGSYTVLDSFTPGIQAVWTFFNLSRGAKINSSTESAKAEELLFNLSARDLVLDIHRYYYKLYSIRQYLNGLEKDYNSNLAQLTESESKYEINPSLKNLNAVQQNKSTLYSQLEELIQQHIYLIEAATSLSSKMGLPLGTLARPANNFKLRPLGSWPLELMPTIEHALNHREEIKIAKTRAKSTSYLATSLKYSYLPQFSLYGYAGYTNQSGINGMSDTNKYNGSYMYGPEANIGLKINWQFDGTVAAAKAKSFEYQSKKFLAEAQSHEDKIEAQAATAFARYTTAKMTLDTSSAALSNALNARETNMQLYKQDQISASSYSTAASAAAIASRSYNKAIFNYNNSISELYRYTSIWPSGISKTLDDAVLVMKSN